MPESDVLSTNMPRAIEYIGIAAFILNYVTLVDGQYASVGKCTINARKRVWLDLLQAVNVYFCIRRIVIVIANLVGAIDSLCWAAQSCILLPVVIWWFAAFAIEHTMKVFWYYPMSSSGVYGCV